jgi:hypothetical protein
MKHVTWPLLLCLIGCPSSGDPSKAGGNKQGSNEPAKPDEPAKLDEPAKPDEPPAQQQPAWPSQLPPPVLSGVIPTSIHVPDSVQDPVDARPFFDHFSWQSFIALNWPALPEQRGVADRPNDPAVFTGASPGATVVWGTYKEAFELFGQGDQRPTPWSSWDVPVNPCGSAGYGKKVMLMANKGGSLLDGVDEAFSFPLIDQNHNYAYTEVRFDQPQYDFIRGKDDDPKSWLYLAKNLTQAQIAGKGAIQMPASTKDQLGSIMGSIMLKATWREMVDADDPSRYYVIEAQLLDPDNQTCRVTKMGLVGFHIVQKIDEFPEWIWSSFEQVDNVERGPGASATTPISFNNGTDSPATTGGWANRPNHKVPPLLPVDQRTPAQITRFNPIPDTPAGASTVVLNQLYQALLSGTVWQHYQLVITQWPASPENPFVLREDGGIYPQDAGGAFPPSGCTNTALESFLQSPTDAQGPGGSVGGNSCMGCHYQAGSADFSFVLQLRAH